MNAIIEAGLKTHLAENPVESSIMQDQVREIARRDLAPLVRTIDAEDLYPEEVLRAFGRAGAYASHLPRGTNTDLSDAITAMSTAAEYCLSTAFCMWCQNALAWYVFNSRNESLHQTLGAGLIDGSILGGTGLSNPMKSFFGIEKMNLTATPVNDGYEVNGRLPWVSNLGTGHSLGLVFTVPGTPEKKVMAVCDFDSPGLTTTVTDDFLALGGTRTYGLHFKNVHIRENQLLADPIDDYLPKIRAGFILMQCGMAFGMVRSCADHMKKLRKPLGHVNQYLPNQPEEFDEKLAQLESTVSMLAKSPFDSSTEYFVRVIQARLDAGELAVQAAHNAMLHAGARGYVTNGFAQRRLRESYFCAIVTPATKQLRKMLSDLNAVPT